MSLLFLVGVLSLLSQVALLRELLVALYGVELVVPLAFATWMLSTAAGAAAGFRAREPPRALLSPALALAAAVVPAEALVLRASRLLFGGVLGAYLPLSSQVALIVLALAPPGILLGLLFQWAAKLWIGRGCSLALAYAVESAGALAGGLAAALSAAAGIQNLAILLGSGGLAAAAALAPWGGRPRTAARIAGGLVLAGLALAGLRAGALDRRSTAWNHPHLVASRDTPYGRVTVAKDRELVSVYEDNALVFETQGTAAEELAHLAAIQHPAPKRMLLLGGGLSGLAGELLEHRPDRIDVVEVNRALDSLVRAHLPPEIREPLESDRIRWHFEDPRRFVARGGEYDLVVVGMPEPSSAQSNRFYTREFFELCASRLAPDGVVAFRLSSAENYLPPPLARRLASIVRAARLSLPHVVVLPGATNFVFASRSPLEREPGPLEERLRSRGIEARLVSDLYVRYLYTNDRFDEVARIAAAEDAPANSDAEPVCFSYTALAWLSMFVPVASLLDAAAALREAARGGALRWVALAALAGAFFATRAAPKLRRALLAAVAGFAGMALETIVLLHYQVKSGVLYQDLGLLLTAFMAGLAAGAFALDLLARRARGGARRSWGVALFLALAGLSAAVALAVETGTLAGRIGAAAALAAAGSLVSAIFAYASLHRVEDQRAAVSPLYAADLFGGCLAAFGTSLVAIPVLGLGWTAWATSLIALAAL